jgi:antitoxin MazE
MKVSKWGNSLAIRLPASVIESLQLQEGDEVDFHRDADGAISVERKATRQEIVDRAIERLRAYRGSLPADFKFDRDEANER